MLATIIVLIKLFWYKNNQNTINVNINNNVNRNVNICVTDDPIGINWSTIRVWDRGLLLGGLRWFKIINWSKDIILFLNFYLLKFKIIVKF